MGNIGIGDLKSFNRLNIHPYFVLQESSKTYNLVCVLGDDSDEPTLPCSLIRDSLGTLGVAKVQ